MDKGQLLGRMAKEFESIQKSYIEGTGLFSNSKLEYIISTFKSDEGSQFGHDGQKNPQGKPNGYTLTYMPNDQYKITNTKYGQEVQVVFQGKGFPKHLKYEEHQLPNDENGPEA